MKTFFVSLFLSIATVCSSQSDWTIKPYVVVNDTVYEHLKLPVFIMDSVLYIRNSEGVVMTFPSWDVNYISKRCFYDRITEKEKNRLSRSVATGSYLSVATIAGGIAAIYDNYQAYLYYSKNMILQYYSAGGLVFGVALIVPSTVAIYNFIQRKRQTKMIIESKGLRLIDK
jgi:hypothetical protein